MEDRSEPSSHFLTFAGMIAVPATVQGEALEEINTRLRTEVVEFARQFVIQQSLRYGGEIGGTDGTH